MTQRYWLVFATLLVAAPALAHSGHSSASFIGGLLHPLSGVDHVLAMIAVGLWAAARGGAAIWAWPTTFMITMLCGFVLSSTGFVMPLVEPLILSSVIVLGLATAFSPHIRVAGGTVAIAAFGVAHGFAHGAETAAGTTAFALGFLLATALLHALGVGLALYFRPGFTRIAGAMTAAVGVAMVAL